MKNRIFYSQMNHDQEQARKKRSDDNAQPKYRDVKGHLLAGELFPNYPDILLNTLLFILCCLPSMVMVILFLMTGGLIFAAGFVASMILTVPAMAALYHRCFSYIRYTPAFVRKSFFTAFRSCFRQGAPCGLVLGILWVLLGFYSLVGQSQTEIQPFFYYAVVYLCLIVVNYFTITVTAQIAQFMLSTQAVLKNGVLLLFLCGWRGAVPAVLQTLYITLLLQKPSAGMLLLFLVSPGVIFTIAAHFLCPRLSGILLVLPDENHDSD